MAIPPILNNCYDVPEYQGRTIHVIRLSPEGNYSASGDQEGVLVILKTDDLSLVRRYKAYDAIKCLAWHPTIPGALVVGAVNGDVIVIKIEDISTDYLQAHYVPGCVHILSFNIDGSQLAVAYATRLAVINLKSFKKGWTIYDIDVPGKSIIRGVHYLDNERLAVCFLSSNQAIRIYSANSPHHIIEMFLMRPDTFVGGSALSPSRKKLAVTNLKDGIDWYDVERRKYSGTTFYDIGSKYIVEIQFLGDNAIVAGHSQGNLILATPSRTRNPQSFKFLAGNGRTQVLTAGSHQGRQVVIAASYAVLPSETINKCVTIIYEELPEDKERRTKNGKPSKARTASTSSLNVWMLGAAAAIAVFEATGWYIIPSLWPNQKGTDVLKITERTTVTVMKEVDLSDGFEQSKVDRYKYALCLLAAFNIAAGVVVFLVWDKRPVKKPKRIRASELLGGGNTVKRGE